jgi:MOSC domain-containing protein
LRARVRHLWRHPIKGHGVEAVASVTLAAGATMPWDRVWAIAHEAARVAPGSTDWARSANFCRGAKSPALMAIRAEVDEAARRVRLSHPRRAPIEVDPDDPRDAARLIDWVTPLADPGRARPAFAVRARVGMTDSEFPSLSILNHASLEALGARLGKPLAMERFRGNVWLEGLAPFAEFDLVGREVRVGGAVLAVREPITRCVATTVDPATGVSDADTLGGLEAGWGHRDFGVYAEVVEGGRVAVGDPAVAA